MMTVSVLPLPYLSDLVGSNCVHCSFPLDLGNKCTLQCVYIICMFVCSFDVFCVDDL